MPVSAQVKTRKTAICLKLKPMVCHAVKRFVADNHHMDYSPPFSHAFDGAIMSLSFQGVEALHKDLICQGNDGLEALAYYLQDLWKQATQIIARCGGDLQQLVATNECLVVWQPLEHEQSGCQALSSQVHKSIQCAIELDRCFSSYDITGYPVNMRIGIASGKMSLVHVGGVYKRLEYHVLGKPLKQCLDARDRASYSGGIVITDEARELVADILIRLTDIDHSKFYSLDRSSLKRRIRISNKGFKSTLSRFNSVKISRYVPAAVLPFLQYSDSLWHAESRHLTILSIQVRFSAKSRIQKSHLARLQKIVQTAMSSTYEYEGSLNKMNVNQKFVHIETVFGLPPLAHEKDPERALLAATDMRHHFRKLGLRCSMGVTTGTCNCFLLGNEIHMEHVLLGEVADRANRLMQMSEGDICCDTPTKLAADNQPRFMFSPTEHDDEKDRDRIWIVSRRDGGVLAFQQKIQVPRYTIGLQKQVQQILDIIQRIRQTGEGEVLEVTGDAGVGKTHLLAEVTKTLENQKDVHVYWGSGDRFKAGCPYTIWATLLDQALSMAGLFRNREGSRINETELYQLFWKEKPGLAAHLHNANDIIGTNFTSSWEQNDRESEKIGNCAKIILFLLMKCREAVQGPMVFVIDEGQCMSPEDWRTTMAVINGIDCGQLKECLVTFCSRPIANEKYKRLFHDLTVDYYDFSATPRTTIVLDAFVEDQTRILIQNFLQHQNVTDKFVQLVQNKTGGNPLYVVKFLTLLIGIRAIKTPEDPEEPLNFLLMEELPVPHRLRRMMHSFLDRLTPSQNLLLRMGACLCFAESRTTNDFHIEHITSVHPIEEWSKRDHIQHDLSYLLRFDYLRTVAGERKHNKNTSPPNDLVRYQFSCGFLRDVVYHGMLNAQKSSLHSLFKDYFAKVVEEDSTNEWAVDLVQSHGRFMQCYRIFQDDPNATTLLVRNIKHILSTFGVLHIVPLCVRQAFYRFECCMKKHPQRRLDLSQCKSASSWEKSVNLGAMANQITLQNPMTERTEFNIRIRDDMEELDDICEIDDDQKNAMDACLGIMQRMTEDENLAPNLNSQLIDVLKFLTDRNAEERITSVLPLLHASEEAVTYKRLLSCTAKARSSKLAMDPNSGIMDEITELLSHTHEWGFDVFELASSTGYPLMYMSFKILRQYDLISRFNIDLKKLVNFLYVVEVGYNINDNPYHNSCHAADTLQSCSVLINCILRHQDIDPLNIYAVLLSCIVHDFIHPGLTSPFCLKYAETVLNLKGVLERIHILAFQKVLELPECNILSNMRCNKEQYRTFKQLLNTFVLSTDLSMHFLFIEKAQRILEREKMESCTDGDGHIDIPGLSVQKKHELFLRMCIKCSDVGNATKPWKIYDKWADKILQEFYVQGDIEQRIGIQITNYMNRKDPQKSPSQHAFITRIVQPMAELFGGFFPEARNFLLPDMRANLARHTPKNTKEQPE